LSLAIKNVSDHVYDYLVMKMSERTLLPGEKIDIKKLCSSLGVSPTPIKEVLVRLETAGYLERLPRRGFAVRRLTSKTLNELVICVGALEGVAASCALPHLTETDLSMMKKKVQEMGTAIYEKDFDRYYDLQLKFHEIYLSRCGNIELENLIASLKKRFFKQNYRMRESEATLTDALIKYNEDHKQIILLFEKQDAEGIEIFLRRVHYIPPTGLKSD
jgi:DNA-binding GntR family transcriptional regulator